MKQRLGGKNFYGFACGNASFKNKIQE